MAFNLHRDQRHEFQATKGVATTVGVKAPNTTLASAFYNGQNLPVSSAGTVTFTPVLGTFFLTLVVMPAVPPEPWTVVEVDGPNTQDLENEFADLQSTNLIIVGN